MLLNLQGEILINPINQTPIAEKWKKYIQFKEDSNLWSFTKQQLLERINTLKSQGKSIIDSAMIIKRFLRELSVNDNFHQQFKAAFPQIDSKSLLGMQLYILLLEDDKQWTYIEPEDEETVFADANYIIEKDRINTEYIQ